jgi:hypothetical protein
MHTIKFSHNWNNKLHNPIFTTIRKYDVLKAKYYKDLITQNFDILLQNKKIGNAKLINMEIIRFNDIPESLLHIDTGYDLVCDIIELFSKFGITENNSVLILTFKNNEHNL